MQPSFVIFKSEADRIKGFFELARHSRVGSFPGQVYQVPLEGMKLLDELFIAYRRATDSEVHTALTASRIEPT